MVRSPIAALCLAGSVAASGCAKKVDCDPSMGECAAEGDSETDGYTPFDPLPLRVNKDVDVLFVIDNSGSMGEHQASLAASVEALIDVLEQADANYRIGITTTDNGNPWCQAGSTPESGQLLLSSCTTRLDDFLFGDTVDVRDFACNDICTLDAAALAILPTTTHADPTAKPRPWLERIEGLSNLPAGTDLAAAFACFGPQGINGCGFESPLESMHLALERAHTADDVNYGFLRPDSILAVVFVTDEADCSYDSNFAQIFDAEGDKVFWSDPNAALPSSAVCWNAGVECQGDPSGYDSCEPVNKDLLGNVGVSNTEAVMQPMSRYIGLLDELEQERQLYNPQSEVIVALIGGVDDSGQPFYADVGDSDPEFQDSFGIGPGCVTPSLLDPNTPIEAVPPVRLRALTEAFTSDSMFSICDGDFTPALAAVAERIEAQIPRSCNWQCVADQDPETPVLEPDCSLTQYLPGPAPDAEVPECLRDQSGYVLDPQTGDYAMPSDAANVCFAMLVDTGGQTPDPLDDMSPECLDSNFNLEFELIRRPGFPAPPGTSLSATCEIADFPDVECPGIGG